MLNSEVIHCLVIVDTRMAFTTVQTTGERRAELANEAMVRYPEIAELEGKAYEVGQEVRGVNTAVDEDSAVDVGMGKSPEG